MQFLHIYMKKYWYFLKYCNINYAIIAKIKGQFSLTSFLQYLSKPFAQLIGAGSLLGSRSPAFDSF